MIGSTRGINKKDIFSRPPSPSSPRASVDNKKKETKGTSLLMPTAEMKFTGKEPEFHTKKQNDDDDDNFPPPLMGIGIHNFTPIMVN